MDKRIWTPQEVEIYLQNEKQKGNKLQLPNDVYCTENFTWNEVLMTKQRNLSMPSEKILNNLYETAKLVQVFRTETGIPITITSSWRTKEEQQKLIRQFESGNQRYEPSTTSLHLEGLAFDVSVAPAYLKAFQKFIDESFIGEVELGSNYTHIGLTTYSEEYLKRNGLYKDNIYRKLNIDDITIQYALNKKLNKRLDPTNWKELPLHFKAEKNKEVFGADKSVKEAIRNLMKTSVDVYLEQQQEHKIRTIEVSMKKEKDKKENLLKKLKSLIKKLQALFEEYQQGQKNSETNNNPTNYVYEDRVNEQSKESQNTATEDDGLVIIPDKYKDKSNVSHYEVYSGKNGKHFIEVYKNNSRSYHITKDTPSSIDRVTNTGARECVLAPKTKVSSANNIIPYIVPDVNQDSGNNLNNTQVLKGHVEKNVDYNNEYAAASEGNIEPEINPEYLKPIELEEDGMATGGAAGISDKFVNPNSYNRDSAESSETSLGDDELSMTSAKKGFDFFENSVKELMKHQRSFRYDTKGGKEYSVSTISRKLDEITKTLDGIQKQLDYHEKVVNIYNTPELAEFYLNRPVRNIMASVFEDYCLMEGIEITR